LFIFVSAPPSHFQPAVEAEGLVFADVRLKTVPNLFAVGVELVKIFLKIFVLVLVKIFVVFVEFLRAARRFLKNFF
jgi:hypothetical protein